MLYHIVLLFILKAEVNQIPTHLNFQLYYIAISLHWRHELVGLILTICQAGHQASILFAWRLLGAKKQVDFIYFINLFVVSSQIIGVN